MSQQPSPPQGSQNGTRDGVLELVDQNSGFLRDPKRNFVARPDDPYVSLDVIRRFQLRGGETIAAATAPVQNKGNRTVKVARVLQINGVNADNWTSPAELSEQTAVDPHEVLRFDTPGGPLTMRIVDLLTPIGRGQRGLIVAPPRTGKTILLQQMAHGIYVNHPDVYMIVLLIDERPEEVTEMKRNVRGEVVASSNDKDVASHIRAARIVIERAKRLAESGQHVLILLDSLTRLARAFNNYVGSSGRTMTGGLDIRALQEPKQIFGAARTIENGGSLTIIASALVETGSRADEFIFQEFKGTGNMELKLDRELANQRIWPAMDIKQSGTRKEEKLLPPKMLEKMWAIRRRVYDQPPPKQILTLLERMKPFKDMESFLNSVSA
ncbi:MAG: Transcription termination factor Rho [Phycisphaerae bacterium]|nr:Transcription termination factor Rho [Phycisphaerae bacterium]